MAPTIAAPAMTAMAYVRTRPFSTRDRMRAPAPVFVPAAGSSDRPVLRTSAERGWVERYDDEPEVRPQIEYLRGVPRQ